MDHKIDKLISAIGDMNTAYLEEAIAFDGAKVGQQKAVRSTKLSAALVAALVILGLSVTAFAISRIPLSWRDIFSTSQTVIGDEDEEPVVSQRVGGLGRNAVPCAEIGVIHAFLRVLMIVQNVVGKLET